MGGLRDIASNVKLRSRCERLAENEVLSVGPQKGPGDGPSSFYPCRVCLRRIRGVGNLFRR